ncbi:MAG: hypothetical protein LBT75_03955 [Bacilli bacterium]|jgi:hypothetical protein|nr:hypothetical protein [Bacilli bacterium]
MKNKIVFITIFIICSFLAIIYQYRTNQDKINEIGTNNGKYVAVIINNEQDYQYLFNYKLVNITKIDYDQDHNMIVSQKNTFDVSTLSNNDFDKNYDDNTLVKNTIFKGFKWHKLPQAYSSKLIGTYFITKEDNDLHKIKIDFEKNNILASEINADYGTYFIPLFQIMLAFILIAEGLYCFITNTLNQKKMNILKLYSHKESIIKYLYGNDLILVSFFTIITSMILIIIFKVSISSVLFYIISVFIVYMMILWPFLIKVSNPISIDSLKGKKGLLKVLNIYKVIVLLLFIMITYATYMLFGESNDNWDLITANANWPLSKNYAIFQNNPSYIKSGKMPPYLNEIYQKFTKNNLIYLDNSDIVNKINTSTYLHADYGIIDVNYNYLKVLNIDKLLSENILMNNDMVLLIPASYQLDKSNKKELCSYSDLNLEDQLSNKCRIITYQDQNVYVNTNTSLKGDSYYDKTIIRVYNDDFLTKMIPINNQYLHIKINPNNDLGSNFNELANKVNNASLVSHTGDYTYLSNLYNDNQKLLKIVADFKITLGIVSIVFYTSIIIIMIMIINLYFSINAKKLFIRKILGYSFKERFLDLIIYLLVALLGSGLLVSLFLIITKIGFLNYKYFLALALFYLLTWVILSLNIKRVENRSISNILKGENL